MHLFFCFLGFLSLGLFGNSKKYAEERNDVPMIYYDHIGKVTTWFFLIGTILPIIILFIYEKWYLAILYSIVGIFVANWISSYYTFNVLNRVNVLPPFIVSIIALIGYIILLFL